MATPRHAIRRWILLVAKIALAAVILGYLLTQMQRHEAMSRLIEEPKDWKLLAAGFLCTLLAISLSFVRWRTLVEALGIRFPLADAMRLGSLGFMLNFVALGTIGGDLFKAVFLARDRPGRRTEAVATVVADRLLGLLAMMLLASGGILATGLYRTEPPALAWLCQLILVATVGGVTGTVLLLFVPGLSGERICGRTEALPLVGKTAARLIRAVRTYRNQKPMLLVGRGDLPGGRLVVHHVAVPGGSRAAGACAVARRASGNRARGEYGRGAAAHAERVWARSRPPWKCSTAPCPAASR